MLQEVDLSPKSLEAHAPILGNQAIEDLRVLAKPLNGARVAHINATPYGGGVSELLRSVVPLYRSLGVDADWLVIPGEARFFTITKAIHNALQGADLEITQKDRDVYLAHSQQVADLLDRHYDFIFVHDPQAAPLRVLHGSNRAAWIWRCHIDTSSPNRAVLDFMQPFITAYDALVFTLGQFVPPGLRNQRVVIIPPAIDPLSPKNMTAPMDLCRQIVEWTGVSLNQLLITQISRFDPWKDPLGVIEVYKLVREEIPGLQLALLGQMALDDPEGWDMYRQITEVTRGNLDIHVLTNFNGIGNMEVNAFQCCSSVILQKSIREGFGLVVSEALWKGTPVVAGRAGGIPMQMPPGVGGYLVDSIEECAEKTVQLLKDPREAQSLGSAGRAHVQRHFLITRLLADELRLLNSLVSPVAGKNDA